MTDGPLDVSLDTVDTSFPLIMPNTFADFLVKEVKIKDNASQTLMITLVTTSPTKSSKGDSLEPGVSVFDNLNLKATGNAKPQYVLANVAAFYQSTGLKGWSLGDVFARHKEFEGQTVRGRVDIKPAGPDKQGVHRPAKNIITEYCKRN